MKAEELRALDADELGGRLRGARRELYELRFKLAVGQQDNHREVRKARKEIARILTVVHQRRLEAVDEGDFEQRLRGRAGDGGSRGWAGCRRDDHGGRAGHGRGQSADTPSRP